MLSWLLFVAQVLFALSLSSMKNAPAGGAIVVVLMLQWGAVLFALLGAIIATRAKTSGGAALGFALGVGALVGTLALFVGT